MSEEEMRLAAVRREAGAQIAKILLSQSESERATAIAVLRNLGPEALNVARELFHQMEDNRRDGSAYVLAALGTSEDKAEVAHVFVDESDNPAPLLALAAASLRDPQLVHRFLQLRTSPDPQVREAVCYGLRASSTPDMSHVLELLADGEPRVRAAAERSVTELLPKAIPASLKGVVDRALSTGEPAARVGALRLAERVSADWSVDMASRATKDANRAVRRAAVRVLSDSGDVRAAPALVELVASGENRLEKVRAASALGKVDADAASLDRLAAAARGEDPVVALAAARSLVERRDARGVPELIRLQHVKKSAELNVDSEDEDLLRGLSTKVLRQASKGTRRRGESYEKWWQRVGRDYKVPASPFVPQFPANH
jgi:HEAT repeat protein